MADYRAYYLDACGILSLAEWIDADSDEEVVLKAREIRPVAHKCEVWLKDRLVAKISSSGRLEPVEPPRSGE